MIASHITIVHYQNQEIDIYVIHRAYSEGRENIRIQERAGEWRETPPGRAGPGGTGQPGRWPRGRKS